MNDLLSYVRPDVRPSVNYEGSHDTFELEKQLDVAFADLVSLSTDMSFKPPVRMVAGKAVFT